MSFDTIAAVATATAAAGIGVVRISGERACEIADSVFTAGSGRKIAELGGYCAAYGTVSDGSGAIDDAIALRFIAPKSYTGEDVVELSCHGGVYVVRRVLRAVLDAGARLAAPGEFTRRAFEHGKLDLTAAEGIMDLIGARGEQSLAAARAAKDGAVFRKVCEIKELLTASASALAAWVDFPDEDVPEVESGELKNQLISAETRLSSLLATAESGRVIREGVDCAIVGRPNVGKSTVMNLLTRFNRSIVTDIPGTTRDVIEEQVSINGVVLRLADTAGLRDTDDPVEAIGVGIAKEKINASALIIAVFDASQPLNDDDRRLLERLKGLSAVVVLNKADLPQLLDESELPADLPRVKISAKFDSPDALEAALGSAAGLQNADPAAGLLANERQFDCARAAKSAVTAAIGALESGMTLDAVGVCIDDALTALCSMTGERASDSVIDEVFSKFCVGK